jgi:hypothetical protein
MLFLLFMRRTGFLLCLQLEFGRRVEKNDKNILLPAENQPYFQLKVSYLIENNATYHRKKAIAIRTHNIKQEVLKLSLKPAH